jgi:hypothetical protein
MNAPFSNRSARKWSDRIVSNLDGDWTMRIFGRITAGRSTAIGIVGLALAVFAVAPAYADNGRNHRHDRWAERSVNHDRYAYLRNDRRAHRVPRVVHHYRGRTVIVVPERHRRAAIRHGHRPDPVVRALIRALNR